MRYFVFLQLVIIRRSVLISCIQSSLQQWKHFPAKPLHLFHINTNQASAVNVQKMAYYPEPQTSDQCCEDFHSLNLRGEVPQTEGPIPGTRQGKLSIWGDDNITYKVRVALQGALGDAIVGFITGQLPHDDRLVWKTNIWLYLPQWSYFIQERAETLNVSM